MNIGRALVQKILSFFIAFFIVLWPLDGLRYTNVADFFLTTISLNKFNKHIMPTAEEVIPRFLHIGLNI